MNAEGGLDKAKDGIERADRIAKTTNKGSFMNLGDNKVVLVSEDINLTSSKHNYQRSAAEGQRSSFDDSYLNDDTVPAEIFGLI
jgi:hypothetical protein